MTHVDLDRIETRLARELRGADELARDAVHVRLGHRAAQQLAAHDADLVEAAARGERATALELLDEGEAAAVRDLRAGRAAMPVHGVGQHPEVRHGRRDRASPGRRRFVRPG